MLFSKFQYGHRLENHLPHTEILQQIRKLLVPLWKEIVQEHFHHLV